MRAKYRRHDAAFIGWFGPLGVAAIYYGTFAVKETGETAIWTAASAVVAASILLHGLSAALLTRRYSYAEDRAFYAEEER